MAVANNAFSPADLAATIPEIWTDIVNTSKFPQAVLTNFCLDLSEFAEEGGDTLHVPDIFTNQLTSSTQSTEGAEITPVTPAQVDDTISVDTHKVLVRIKVVELLEALKRVISSQALAGKVQRLGSQAISNPKLGEL